MKGRVIVLNNVWSIQLHRKYNIFMILWLYANFAWSKQVLHCFGKSDIGDLLQHS